MKLLFVIAILMVSNAWAQDLGASISLESFGGESNVVSKSKSGLAGSKTMNIHSTNGQSQMKYDDGSDKEGHSQMAYQADGAEADVIYNSRRNNISNPRINNRLVQRNKRSSNNNQKQSKFIIQVLPGDQSTTVLPPNSKATQLPYNQPTQPQNNQRPTTLQYNQDTTSPQYNQDTTSPQYNQDTTTTPSIQDQTSPQYNHDQTKPPSIQETTTPQTDQKTNPPTSPPATSPISAVSPSKLNNPIDTNIAYHQAGGKSRFVIED